MREQPRGASQPDTGKQPPRAVMSGPFAGITYVSGSVGSALTPKLIGCYERELHGVIEGIGARKPRRIGGFLPGKDPFGRARQSLRALQERLKKLASKAQKLLPRRGPLYTRPSAHVKERVAELRAAIPAASLERGVTMAVAVVEDAKGERLVLIATSEPKGKLRRGVSVLPGERLVEGFGHAEENIAAECAAANLTIIDIGATRGMCIDCERAMPDSAHISTAVTGRRSRKRQQQHDAQGGADDTT